MEFLKAILTRAIKVMLKWIFLYCNVPPQENTFTYRSNYALSLYLPQSDFKECFSPCSTPNSWWGHFMQCMEIYLYWWRWWQPSVSRDNGFLYLVSWTVASTVAVQAYARSTAALTLAADVISGCDGRCGGTRLRPPLLPPTGSLLSSAEMTPFLIIGHQLVRSDVTASRSTGLMPHGFRPLLQVSL